jgi:hypothetical protein
LDWVAEEETDGRSGEREVVGVAMPVKVRDS